jgi:hypothetical protein
LPRYLLCIGRDRSKYSKLITLFISRDHKEKLPETAIMPRKPSKSNETVLGIISGSDRSVRSAPDNPSSPSAGGSSPPAATQKFSFVYALLNPRSKRWQAVWFRRVIATVILIDLVSFILSTEPSLKGVYNFLFHFLEGVSSSVFLMEYIARVITCVEREKYSGMGPILGRLRFMMSTSALIDALASMPFFLEQLVNVDLPRLTYLRFFRLLRITKTTGAMRATDAVYRVVYYNAEIVRCMFSTEEMKALTGL